MSRHAPDGDQQLAHRRDDGDLSRLARGSKSFVILAQPRIAADGVENHHPERPTQASVSERNSWTAGEALLARLPSETRWLLLIHQIPPKPDYFRVKIWRRLQRVGAVAIKNSVYVLPKSDQTLEDFQWILREIAEGGGEASLCEAGFVEGLSDSQIEALFRAARDADYASIADEARELSKKLHPLRADEDTQRRRRRL
jgi:hypothetical protein